MARASEDGPDEAPGPLLVAVVGLVVVGAALAILQPLLLVPLTAVGIALVVTERRRRSGIGLQIDQIDRLREAELALATTVTTDAAARQLAEHAIALLDAASATVLIENVSDTVRVTAGDPGCSVYGPGSRMRLLDDDGVPCGSIAVSSRADGRPYTPQQEHMLDALAQRVSSTLHRLSLFDEVQDERQTLSDVVGSSSDGIFSVGPDLIVRSWNPAMARITGVDADTAIRSAAAAVFRPVDDEGRPWHAPSQPDAAGTPGVIDLRLATAHHGDRWLTCSWSPLSEGGYVVVARDDTERKQLQDDKDGWIAQVSHELRTPLTPIKGFLHTLQRREDQLSQADRHRIYDVMLREEQRLEHLVNGLLQTTSLDSGNVVVAPEEIVWRSVVADQLEVSRRGDEERPIMVVIDPAIDRVVVDPSLAMGVLANLVSNAQKYSPADTPIEVRTQLRRGQVITTVSDCGPGVPAADRERIFDKFTRLGDHLTRPQQGIGLGLYLARRAVEQLGGEIWCDERPGGGAQLSFSFPAVDYCSEIVTDSIVVSSEGVPGSESMPVASMASTTSIPSTTLPKRL
jgi:signal transduction histidine kinase